MNYVVNQLEATKRTAEKRAKYLGVEHAINYIYKLMHEFPKNTAYYRELIKGIKKAYTK